MPSACAVVELLRLAHELYREALRSSALEDPFGATLWGHLLALGSQPTREALLAWSRELRSELPTTGHMELVACSHALELELDGKPGAAVLVLGRLLALQRRLEAAEVDEVAADLGTEPTAEALRAVLQTWSFRLASSGGPILGRLRDFRERLEEGGDR
jgi:hypothetical protein